MVGSIEDALDNTLVAGLDLATLPPAEAYQVLEPGPRCAFARSPETDPVLWASADGGAGAIKLNGVIVPLRAEAEIGPEHAAFAASGITLAVDALGEEADWRSNAELVFELDPGLSVGYRGFYRCEA